MNTNSKINCFKNAEDLALFLERHPNDDTRYTLEVNEHVETWVNEDAGRTWAALEPEYVGYSHPGRKAYEKLQKEHDALKPATKTGTQYRLYEVGRHWTYQVSSKIELAPELGQAILSNWKTMPRYPRSRPGSFGHEQTRLAGMMTLKGILKRLTVDNPKIIARIDEAKNQLKEKMAKRVRNNARLEVQKLAQQILNIQAQYPEIIWPSEIKYLVNKNILEPEE
jgi:hypothetical protein